MFSQSISSKSRNIEVMLLLIAAWWIHGPALTSQAKEPTKQKYTQLLVLKIKGSCARIVLNLASLLITMPRTLDCLRDFCKCLWCFVHVETKANMHFGYKIGKKNTFNFGIGMLSLLKWEHTWSLWVQMNHRVDTVANCTQVHQCSPCHCCKEYLSSSWNLSNRH